MVDYQFLAIILGIIITIGNIINIIGIILGNRYVRQLFRKLFKITEPW